MLRPLLRIGVEAKGMVVLRRVTFCVILIRRFEGSEFLIASCSIGANTSIHCNIPGATREHDDSVMLSLVVRQSIHETCEWGNLLLLYVNV